MRSAANSVAVFLSLVAVATAALESCSEKHVGGDFKMKFPQQGVTDYAVLPNAFKEELTKFTIAFWVKMTASGPMSLFSYATDGAADTIRISWRGDNGIRTKVLANDEPHAGPFSLNDGTWRHVAVTWHNGNGRKRVFVDGEEKLRDDGNTGERIPANGTLVLGQDQDSVGGGFQANESFAGELANVNVWNYRLGGEELTHVATYCGCGQGDVVAWSDLRGNTQGNVEVEATGCRVLGRGQDCLDLMHQGKTTSGVYVIDFDDDNTFPVLCDQETNGGGWFVIQKRLNGSVDFARSWETYSRGFGALDWEFWLGNDRIHRLSTASQSNLLIELEDISKTRGYAYYREFSVAAEAEGYKLWLSGSTSTVPEKYLSARGREFSTSDEDNDNYQSGNCAQVYGGGWWYGACHKINLNGRYFPDGVPDQPKGGIYWQHWKKDAQGNEEPVSLTRTAMKIRPLRELHADYSLLFGSDPATDNVTMPRVTAWSQSTVSWWMKLVPSSSLRSVFALENSQFQKATAFHVGASENSASMFINDEMIALNTSFALGDDSWHHVCITWENGNGQWTFLLDGHVVQTGSDVQKGNFVQEGRLVIGKTQGAPASFSGELSHFNVWSSVLSSEVVRRSLVHCQTLVGDLVPWPQVKIWRGNVEVKKFIRCYNRESNRFNLAERVSGKMADDFSSRKVQAGGASGVNTALKVLSVTGDGFAFSELPPSHCLIAPDNCENGLSLSLWLQYPAYFAQSHIVGGNQRFLSTLNGWLEPLMPPSARWVRCHRAVEDGFAASVFHANCDLKGPTVTIVKKGNNVFGGFLDDSWGGGPGTVYGRSAFVFSLRNRHGTEPRKFDLYKNVHIAGRNSAGGPKFANQDLVVGDNCDSNPTCHSYLDSISYGPASAGEELLFVGIKKFTIDDYEVFHYDVPHQPVGVSDTNVIRNDQISAGFVHREETNSAPKSRWDTQDDIWCPYVAATWEWLQHDLGSDTYIKKFRIGKGNDRRVKKIRWTCTTESGSQSHPKDENINGDSNKKYSAGKTCRYFKVQPIQWDKWPCMRLQLLDNSEREIDYPDEKITASTEMCMSPAKFGRLGGTKRCLTAWCGRPVAAADNYLAINMGRKLYVAYVAIAGPQDKPQDDSYYVTRYRLQQSLDGSTWEDLSGPNYQKDFQGYEGVTRKQALLPPVYTHHLKFLPSACHHLCCLRVEIYELSNTAEKQTILSTRATHADGSGVGFFRQYDMPTGESSYRVQVATTTRLWELELTSLPVGWHHVVITWRIDWGLKLYENGRIRAATNSFQSLSTNTATSKLIIGRQNESISTTSIGLQVSGLGIWEAHLSEEQVRNSFSLAGPSEDVLMLSNVQQNGDYFDWNLLYSGCDSAVCSNISESFACRKMGPLGLAGYLVPDSDITASSIRGQPKWGRLHNSEAWFPKTLDSPDWIQVCFPQLVRVIGVMTQGRPTYNQWVTSYKVFYSFDGISFRVISENGQDKIFPGNSDRNTVVTNLISPTIVARCVRIVPHTYRGYKGIRFEVIGCRTGAMYIDASYPRKKGDKARLQSAYLLHTHTCLRFSYHMNGSATGRLNVYKQSYNGTQALLWRLADRQGLGWRPAEVPLAEDLPYRIIFEGVVGSGYDSDMGVHVSSVNVGGNCTFFPENARTRLSGIVSSMISHVPSYQDLLTTWLAQSGQAGQYWKPCYRLIDDGWNIDHYFDNCKGPTLIIARASSYIFGGFSTNYFQKKVGTETDAAVFLFSLKNPVNESFDGTKVMLKNMDQIAITHNQVRLQFGNYRELAVEFSTQTIVFPAFGRYGFSSPSVPNPTLFFSDTTKPDDIEILVPGGDTTCDPPCLLGQKCDEIIGKCICEELPRDVGMCRRRADLQRERDEACKTNAPWNATTYARFDLSHGNGSDKAWRCYGEDALTGDRRRFNASKSSDAVFNHSALTGMLETGNYSVLLLDALTRESVFYWSMDDEDDVKNLRGSSWASVPGGAVSEVKGVKKSAINIDGSSGLFTLTDWEHSGSCAFVPMNCHSGLTISLWLKFLNKSPLLSQSFISTSNGNKVGFRIYQPAVEDTLAFEVTTESNRCTVSIAAAWGRWAHYVVGWAGPLRASNLTIHENGVQISKMENVVCTSGSFDNVSTGAMTVGEGNVLPLAALDEVLVWYKTLTEQQIRRLFEYYKEGGVRLQVEVMFVSVNETWNISLNDPETEKYKNFSRDVIKQIQAMSAPIEPIAVEIRGFGDNSGNVGIHLVVGYDGRGYEQLEPLQKNLSTLEEKNETKIHKFEANNVYYKQVIKLRLVLANKTSLTIAIDWTENLELSQGVFQGYEFKYVDALSGTERGNLTVYGSKQERTIGNLTGYTQYNVSARALTLEGPGVWSHVFCNWTAEYAPTLFPPNLTAVNTSSTSLNVSWDPISPRYPTGIVRGYIVRYWVRDQENATKKSKTMGSTLSGVLSSLETWTEYALQIAAFTLPSEIGPFGNATFAKTAEDVPIGSPEVTVNKTSTSVKLYWSPIPEAQHRGIIRSYHVQCQSMRNASIPPALFQVAGSTYHVELKNLSAYQRFNCCVQAVTVGPGPCGSAVFHSPEGAPTAAPVVIKAHNTSSTSLTLSWAPLANASVPGVLKGYSVSYQHGLAHQYVAWMVCSGSLTLNLTGLEKFTTYNLSVAAFTVAGSGPYSPAIPVTTDEDIPEPVPQNFSTPEAEPDSITLAWSAPKDKNGVILGYRIVLYDTLRNETKEIVVNSSVATLDDLMPYTDYKAKIYPFTRKGEGNGSDFISVKTEEAPPSKPPRNVSAQNSSSTEIFVQWKPVNRLFVNGKIRSYVIYYFETFSQDKTVYNISIPIEEARKRRRRAISGDSPEFQLDNLKKYTTYTVQLAAYTVGTGVKSPQMNVTTAEDVPSLPPANITAYNTSSTSLRVDWLPVPADHLNGILRGYKVFYRRADKPEPNPFIERPTDTSTQTIDLPNLGKFKPYDIRVLAVTVGDGNRSEPLLQRTDQDIPDLPPINFTSFPLNTTAIEMKWLHVPQEEQNGIILGYNVQLYDVAGNNIRNTTLDGANTTSVVLAGLEIWTNYSYRVSAFTVKGEGPWSAVAKSRTAEEAPRTPPTNVTAHNTSSTSLFVSWQAVNASAIRGILRGYRVFYYPEDTVHPRTLKNTTVGPAELQVELVNLYKYTNYSVSVAAFTIADGVRSEVVYARTHEDRPDKPPANLMFALPSSSSLRVQWQEVPEGYRNGIIRSYTVQYEQTDGKSPALTESVPADTLFLVISALRKFHHYNVSVWANTSIGSGPPSEPKVMTDQDVPNIPPPNITADNFTRTHTLPLQWDHIPFLETNGILLGYRIRYEIVNMGQYPYVDDNPQQIDVPPGDTSVVLQNLESFAMYRVQMTGFTIKGEGPPGVIFGETCRCVKRLTTNWLKFEPYVDLNMTGLVPPVFNDMAVECCRSCKTHGKSWVDFDWDGDGNPALKTGKQELRRAITHKTDFHFPVYGFKMQDSYQQEFGYIGLIESPGIAYIVNTDSGDQVAEAVMSAIFGTWPLIMLCLMMAYLAGVLLWVTERPSDEAKFPRSFIGGAAEGLWWAYVTMTTVGYGDRTAMTILGRIVGIAWTLIGLVINGILVSALANALTMVSSGGSDFQLYGSKVAALFGSAEYNLAIRKNAKLDYTQQYKDYSEMYELLVNRDVEGALIDAYTVGSQKSLFEKPFLRIVKIYDYSSVYGAVTAGDSRKLQKCFNDYVPMNIAKIIKHIESIVEAIEEPTEPLSAEISSNLFSSESVLFQKTLLLTGAMLAAGFLFGIAFEFFRRSRSSEKVGVDDGKDNNNELREMLEEFQGKMQDVHAELTGRHQRQMLKLQQMRGDNKGLWYMVFTDKLGRRTSKASELGSTDLELMHRTEGFLNNAANSSSDGFNPRATETLETKHYDREKAASPGQVNCGQDETEA